MRRLQTLKKKRNRRRAAAQALWEATCDGDFEKAKTAIQSAVTCIDIRRDTSTTKSMAPLHQACELGHVQIARLLIDSGANVNIKNGEGQTPLHCASQRGHFDIVELLLDAGVQ